MCSHERCNPQDRVWAPKKEEEPTTTRRRYYCTKCGLVFTAEGKRAKDLGYFQNCLAQLSKILENRRKPKITQVQTRLIMKELENQRIADHYVHTYEKQQEIFIKAVQKYVRVGTKFIKKVL